MMRALPTACIAALLCTALPVSAGEPTYAEAFVAAFAEACVPQRMSYEGTRANAESLGWTAIERDAHPELASLMERMDREAAPVIEDADGEINISLYGRDVAELPHVLIVGKSVFYVKTGSGDAPERWAHVGCYIYNFDASEPIDPAPVTAMTGNPIANGVNEQGLVGYVWGPPCAMPRTGDTYLTFVAEGSPFASQVGFTGLTMKFDTSEPEPGEVVPDTYC